LAATWLVSAGVVVPWALVAGPHGAGASALAAWVTCVVSGVVAWWLVRRYRAPQQVLVQVALAMAARTGIPLGMCMAVYRRPGVWADAGFVYYLLIFYFVTLVVETLLQVASVSQAASRPEDPPAEVNGLDHG
jgi:hypothetical protein